MILLHTAWNVAIYNARDKPGSPFAFRKRHRFPWLVGWKGLNVETKARWNSVLIQFRSRWKMVFCQTNKSKQERLIIPASMVHIARIAHGPWPYLAWKVSEEAPEKFYLSLAQVVKFIGMAAKSSKCSCCEKTQFKGPTKAIKSQGDLLRAGTISPGAENRAFLEAVEFCCHRAGVKRLKSMVRYHQ